MERREFIALIGIAAAGMPQYAAAEPRHAPDSMAGRLVGTWSFTSSVNTRRDGTTFERWGANPTGIFMFDRNGNYAQIILGSESKVFGSKVVCGFGTYTIDEAQKALLTRITSSSTARIAGTTQSRTIMVLTETEFKYTNPLTSLGATAEVLWKRIA